MMQRTCYAALVIFYFGASSMSPSEIKRFRFHSSQNNCVGGPCGPQHQQCAAAPKDGPQFHISDATCNINDPNGVFYDHVHGSFHVFYQDHLAMGIGVGPVWGHAVSKDLVHWARMPVALWNDRPYDANMLWSGSATIVDGQPTLVYPGGTISPPFPLPGFMLSAAVPADPSDPLYTNWTKLPWNPLINSTQRDPSTAWKTPAGEWRIVTYAADMYGSMDFKSWTHNGKAPFITGECPSFFPLPPLYPGSAQPHHNYTWPTHVAKYSVEGWTRDAMNVGIWEDGPPGTAGTWRGLPAKPDPAKSLIDAGDFYASKDLYDSAKGRRLNIGWVVLPPAVGLSALSLPRHLTWHAELQQLMHSPVEEQATLRGTHLVSQEELALGKNDSVWLGNWANSSGRQAEAIMSFARPNASTIFGIEVMAGQNVDRAGNSSTRIFLQYEVAESAVQVGVTSGNSGLNLLNGGPRSSLNLLAKDDTFELRVFVDHTFIEVYWMDGRVAMTSKLLGASPSIAGMKVFNVGNPVSVHGLNVWHVNSIWVSPEYVLQAPRADMAQTTFV